MLLSIADYAPTLEDLKSLGVGEFSCLLLRRLATLYRDSNRNFHKGDMRRPGDMSLANGYPDGEKRSVMDFLFAQPWQKLLNDGHIADYSGNGFFHVTDSGYKQAKECSKNPSVAVDQTVIDCIRLLHVDLQSYATYFRQGKLKEAVAAAFELYDNRLNEIRDKYCLDDSSAKKASGQSLIFPLFDAGVLKLPYPKLGRSSKDKIAFETALKGLLLNSLGWMRNSYEHEKHNLPDIDPQQALELLFVASYLLRMLEVSFNAAHP